MKYAKILVTIFVVAAANSFATWYYVRCGKFSPDGSKVVFLLSRGAYGYDMYTVNADGSGKVKLEVPGGFWGEPYFSPDGSKIAVINDDFFFLNGNVFLVDVDGKNLRQLTNYGDDPFEESWDRDLRTGVLDEGLTFSPDGRKILYCSAEFGTSDIFAINVDGTGKTRLTDFAGYKASGPVFLPRSEDILFTVKGRWEKGGIWIMNVDGSGKRRLSCAEDVELVALSPDGKKIAYVERRGDERATYVAASDGSSRFKVADVGPVALDLSFSPDGKKVLYCLPVEGRVYVVNADGSARKNLRPAWDYVSQPAFFADSAKIAFVGRTWPDSGFNIYTMDADGSNPKLFTVPESMHIRSLTVSPTGDRFLIRGEYYGEVTPGYFAVNADGSGLVRLTKKGEFPDD